MQEENQEEKNKRKTTLGELGLTFPIYDGSENLSFSFKEWDMDIEEKLSDLQEDSSNVGKFVRSMMDLLLDEFKGKDYQEMSKEEKIIALSQLHFPNMMYMYMALRVEELGHELNFENIQCPHCSKQIKHYVADLRTLDVFCKDEDHEQVVSYELKKPITMEDPNGGKAKIITGLEISISKWDSLENVPQEKAANSGFVKKAIFNSAISGCTNNEKPVEGFIEMKALIRKIKKVDIERIGKKIVENNAGPDMKVALNCKYCRKDFEKQVSWEYESFFDSSSL